MEKFINRHEAGRILASSLQSYMHDPYAIVLALPRGGVPVAYEIAMELFLPLDLFIVRKLGVPGHEELAMGAIASGEVTVMNQEIIDAMHISSQSIEAVKETEKAELKRREKKYRGKHVFPDLKDKTIILADDGIATGSSIRAAIQALKKQSPAKLIVACPVAAYDIYSQIVTLVDEIICPLQPLHFYSVSVWYEDFAQTKDEEVIALLTKAYKRRFPKDKK